MVETEERSEPKIEPNIDPKIDLGKCEQIDLVEASITRFRKGSHPKPEIEALLQRRLNIDHKNCLVPYPVRLLCTWGIILVVCGFSWTLLWAFFSFLGFQHFLTELSALMAGLMIALMAFGLSHPINIYDEQTVEKSGIDAIRSLRMEIADREQQKPVESSLEPSEVQEKKHLSD